MGSEMETGKFVLAFRVSPGFNPTTPDGFVMWYMREGLACFNIEDAMTFWYEDEAKKYLRENEHIFGFEVEEIKGMNL